MSDMKSSAKEREMLEKARQYLPGGSLGNVSLDVVIREGRGARVWDLSGNEYVDYMLGSGPMILGHAHPEVMAAVREQLERGYTFFASNEYAIQLAEEIVKAVPCADKVRFCSTGTEATLYAMRAARAFRKRDKVLKFEGAFHGMNEYALMSMAPVKPPDYPAPAPDTPGIPRSVQQEVLIAPFNDIETTSAIIERHHDELGGVIVEPFQRLVSPKPGFLEGLREATRQYEIPLVYDEIVTGFRLAYGGAQEYYGVTPDLCTLGKALAGGYTLTALAGREDLMSHFDSNAVGSEGYVVQRGTLSGNPVAAVAGLATLKILKREGTYERLFATGQQIMDGLQRLCDEAEIPARVVGIAPMFEVFFTDVDVNDYRSSLKGDAKMKRRFNQLLPERGVLKGDTKMYVSTVHTQEDVDLTLSAFASAIDELKG